MHRSGTSAVTRVLASLGCDLPNTLMEADSNNAMGYWESTEIADLNDAILASAGSSWDDCEAFNPDWYASLIADDFRERARAVLTSEFGDSRLFVLKDPRICRLLQFWTEALDGIGAMSVVALPVRNPLEVAASLQVRDAIHPSIGVLIWLRNVLDAEASSRGLPRAFTRYQDVLDNWKSLASRLGSELEVAWPKRSTIADLEIESFIASSIRHHAQDDARVHQDPSISRWVKTAFEILDRWACGNVRKTDAAKLDSIRMAFDDSGQNFSRPIAIGRRAMQTNRAYEAQIDSLDRTGRERIAEVESLEQAIRERDRQIADLDKAVRERDQRVADRDSRIDSLDRTGRERIAEVESLEQAMGERDGQIADLDKAVRERDQRVADRDSRIDSLDRTGRERIAEVESLEQAMGERDGQIADLDSRIDSLDRTGRERIAEVESLEQAIRERDRQIADLDKAVRERDQRVADRDSRIDSLDRTGRELIAEVESLEQAMGERDGQIADLDKAVRERDQRVADRDSRIDSLDRTGRERIAEVESLEQAMGERDGQIADLDKAVRERDQQIADRDSQLTSVSQLLSHRDQQVADRDSRIDSFDRTGRERVAEVESLEQAMGERDGQIADLDEVVRERDQQVADRDSQLTSVSQLLSHRDQQVADRDSRIDSLNHRLASQIDSFDRTGRERIAQVESLEQAIGERDRQIADLDRAVGERIAEVESAEQAMGERDGQIADLDEVVRERDQQVADLDESLQRTIAERDARTSQIEAIHGSMSWRIIRPLRFLKIVVSRSLRSVRHLGRRTPSARRYVASGRLQLADRNFDAANNQGDMPVLFDPEYYVAANEDVRNNELDPLRHYLKQGAVEGRLPFALEPGEIDPEVETLHRIDTSHDDAFDGQFYRDLNPDLAHSDDTALFDHYSKHGRAESRAGSRGEFVRQICDDPREIPLDFKAAEYIDLYPDLNGYAERSPLEALRHYMCHGRWEPRLYTHRGDATIASPDPTSIDMPPELMPETRPLCVLVHIYYPDLWEELSGYLANLPEDTYDLYVNLVDTTFTQELEQRIRDAFPVARIYVGKNIGRDIGGYFQLLRNVSMEDYRFFCLIHSKKSPHLATGDALLWRRRLLTPLLGTRKLAVENLRLMLTDETIGLIGARRCRDTELKDNAEKFIKLLDLLNVGPESRDVEFLSGTMMYLRREILQRIFESCKDLPFEKGDDTPLQFHLDAQWAHAIERGIGNVVRDMNYRFEWR